MLETLFSPLFAMPFLTGLVMAPLLALLGAWLRLREEWLAAMAYAQIAAAGGVLAAVFHWALIPGALLVAGLAAVAKGLWQRAGNDHFALFIILGWGATLLLPANSAQGERVGRALLDGQLYFTTTATLITAVMVALVSLTLLYWMAPRLLQARFYPDHFRANNIPAWPHQIGFDLLAVAVIALGTMALGVMAAFALVFIPAWIAFHLACGWRQVIGWSMGLSLLAYVPAFVLAIALDQPFAPVLTMLLVLLTPLRLLPIGGTGRMG